MLNIVIGSKNKILRKVSEEINEITPQLKEFFLPMIKKMKKLNGIGLAAPQIGKNIRLFVVDVMAFNPELSSWRFEKYIPKPIENGYIFINPEIRTFSPQKHIDHEGCLSLPQKSGPVLRAKKIVMSAQDQNGKRFKLHAKGLLARVLQHEMDHLNGILICDKWQSS